MQNGNAENVAEPDFQKKTVFWHFLEVSFHPGNRLFGDFHQTFSLYFVVFHTKALFITMLTIKYGSIVNKTDFCSRDSLKIAGTANFSRKNSIY